jgi:hypothetical protein
MEGMEVKLNTFLTLTLGVEVRGQLHVPAVLLNENSPVEYCLKM